MIDLHPTTCNICGGKVIYTDNSAVYGKSYGNTKIYLCTDCGAYVGVNKERPDEAVGLLANHQMRKLKKRCRDEFDKLWKYKKTEQEKRVARREAYKWLAKEMKVSDKDCNFGYFDLKQLSVALSLINKMNNGG